MQSTLMDRPANSLAPAHSTYPADTLAAERLLERCRAGESGALSTLLSRYERPIYHLAFRLAGNYDDAHDVAAEAALRICQGIGTCKSAVTLPAWINRIVANVFYDMYRRSQKCPSVSLDLLAEKTNGAVFAGQDLAPASPQSHVEARERKSILDGAISRLPEYQRRIVTLFYHEDRSYEEIAQLLGIPVGTVKSRLNRARLTLLEKLDAQKATLIN